MSSHRSIAALLPIACAAAAFAAEPDTSPWYVAQGAVSVRLSGADCPFASTSRLTVAFAWPARGEAPVEAGLLRIEDRFVYPLDETGGPAGRTLTYLPGERSLQIAGTFALPRRTCTIDVERATLAAAAASGSPQAWPWTPVIDRALAHYRRIRSARPGNAEERAAAEKAVAEMTASLGDANPLLSASALRVGEIFTTVGDSARALPLLERAWKGYAASAGDDDIDTLIAMDRAIWARRDRQVGADLVQLAERARELSFTRWGERHPQSLRTRHTLAVMYSTVNEMDRAVEEGLRAYEGRRAVLGAEHLDTLRSLNNLAADYRNVGRLRQALDALRELYETMRRTQGPDALSTLVVGNNLALLYSDLGDSAAAIATLDAVYPRLLATVGPKHPETARTLNAIGTVIAKAGRHEESLETLRRVAEIRAEVHGPDHPLTLLALQNVAASLLQSGRNAEAADILRQVVAGIDRLRLPDDDMTVAMRKNHLVALHRSGQSESAAAVAPVTLRNALARLSPTRANVLDLRFVVAEVQVAAGDAAAGLQAMQQALRDARATFGDEHPSTLSGFDVVARTLGRLGHEAEAAALLADAVAAVERARASPMLLPEYRQALTALWRPHYANLASHHVRARAFAQAFAVVEASKARGLLESIARNRGLSGNVLPRERARELREYEVRLGRLDERIGAAGDDVTRKTALEAERNDLLRAERALRAELARKFPKFGRLSEARLVDARSGARAIGRDAVFVSYLLTPEDVLAFALDDRGHLSVQRVRRPKDLEARIEAVRLLVSTPPGETAPRRPWRLADGSVAVATRRPAADATPLADIDALTAELGRLLLDPLQPQLQGKPRWIISPDGVLALLPFDVLAVGHRRAVEVAEISYVQSLSVLNEIRQRKAGFATLKRDMELLAFGNPDYGDAARPMAISAAPAVRSGQRRGTTALPMLPASALELELVAANFPSDGVRVYSGADASEPAFRALNATHQLGRFRYLVLSAHGVMDDEAPALSAIVLAQDRTDDNDDGYITAAEWPQYDLHTDLVVLSACETATGKVVTGEGVLGLPYALFVAGNAESLLTLWKIEDRGAAEFSGRVFKHLRAGATPSRAVVLTKREFLRGEQFGRPFFWAPYVLYGG